MTDLKLTSHHTLVLSKLIKDNAVKAARPDLLPGSYPVEIELKIIVNGEARLVTYSGNLSVENDTTRRPTSQLLSWGFIIFLLHRLGCLGPTTLKTIRDCASEFIRNGQNVGEGLLPLVKDVEGQKKAFEQMLEELPRTPVRGDVSLVAEIAVSPLPAEERKYPQRTKVG